MTKPLLCTSTIVDVDIYCSGRTTTATVAATGGEEAGRVRRASYVCMVVTSHKKYHIIAHCPLIICTKSSALSYPPNRLDGDGDVKRQTNT
jgi:hypothetical protein